MPESEPVVRVVSPDGRPIDVLIGGTHVQFSCGAAVSPPPMPELPALPDDASVVETFLRRAIEERKASDTPLAFSALSGNVHLDAVTRATAGLGARDLPVELHVIPAD